MATAAAAATLMERVEPYWPMRSSLEHPESSAGPIPSPSEPKIMRQRSGRGSPSSRREPGPLSMATTS